MLIGSPQIRRRSASGIAQKPARDDDAADIAVVNLVVVIVFDLHDLVARRECPRPPLALSGAEQDLLLGVLDSERFVDVVPAAVVATLR